MRRPPGLTAAGVALAALILSACGADDEPAAETETPTTSEPPSSLATSEGTLPVEPTTESTPTSEEPTSEEPSSPAEDVVEVEIEIEDGEISPLGETVEAKPGQQIRLEVDSDTHDELHLHSDPEQSFEVTEGDDQVFTFSLPDPAVYEMESHELGVVVVKFQISG